MPTGTEGAPRAEGWPGAAEEERACRSRGQSTASDVESGAAAVQFASATNGATTPHDAPADTCASLAEAPAAAGRTARTGPGNGALQVVYGAKRIGCAAYELQCHASRRVRGMAKPPYVATRTLDSLESRKLVEGVRYQVIYDRSALARPPQLDITTKLVAQGEQARVLHAAPTKMIMVDEDAALLPLVIGDSVESAIIVRGSAMLAALGRIFDDLWRFAAPFTAERDLGGDRRPTEEERWILSLLASGATDDAIGRLMGFSPRTAHRRVRELITRLGVETRFQAGMQAVRLGWL